MNSVTVEQPLLLSLDDAAQRLSVSRRTLEREIVHGRFPQPVKIGRSTRVSFAALEAYIRKLTGEGSPA
jgi:excisionase family DNA binding protein